MRLLLIPFLILATSFATIEASTGYDDTSVMIICDSASGSSSGSGVVFQNGDNEFIWTAAHVVSSAEKIDNEFDDVKVIKYYFNDGNRAGEDIRQAEIIRYSDPINGYDLALLKTSYKIGTKSCEFANKEPKIGDNIYFVGSPGGYFNMYIKGHVMADRRGYFTQVNLSVTGGASGGPIFNQDNKVLGLVTLVNDRQRCLAFAVSTTIIRRFAKESDCEWAVNNKIAVPESDGWRLKCPRCTPLKIKE